MADNTGDARAADTAVDSAPPVLTPAGGMFTELGDDFERAAACARAAPAAAAYRACASGWRIRIAWYQPRGLQPIPAHSEHIAAVVTNQTRVGTQASTVRRRVAAIDHHRRATNHPPLGAHPEAGGPREAMASIRCERTERKTCKAAADAAALRHMLAKFERGGLRATRDRARCRHLAWLRRCAVPSRSG